MTSCLVKVPSQCHSYRFIHLEMCTLSENLASVKIKLNWIKSCAWSQRLEILCRIRSKLQS